MAPACFDLNHPRVHSNSEIIRERQILVRVCLYNGLIRGPVCKVEIRGTEKMSGLQIQVVSYLLRRMRKQRRNAGADLAPTVFRNQLNKAAKRETKLPEDARVTEVKAGGVPAEWIERSSSRAHRVILYFHGGGYSAGSPKTHRLLISKLCEQAHARALVPDYRLAPEQPFPAAFDDAMACYRWLLASGIDPAGIVLAGDSAGGGLALAAAMGIRNEGLAQPGALVLLSPWADLAQSGRSVVAKADADPFLDIYDLATFSRSYLDGHIPTDWRASPLYGDFYDLPSILVHAGSNEVLLDDAVRISSLAEAAGVDVSVEVFDGLMHVFQAFPISEADASIARLGSFIRSRTVLAAVAKTAAQ